MQNQVQQSQHPKPLSSPNIVKKSKIFDPPSQDLSRISQPTQHNNNYSYPVNHSQQVRNFSPISHNNNNQIIQSQYQQVQQPVGQSQHSQQINQSPLQISNQKAQQPYKSQIHQQQHSQPQFQSQFHEKLSQDTNIQNVVNQFQENKLNETCPTHLNQVVTNICCNPKCMEPLCPKCIKSHITLHNQTGTECQIEHIDDKRIEALQELKRDRTNLEKEKELLGHFNEQGKQELIQMVHQKLIVSKQKVQNKVDYFFSEFEAQLSNKIAAHKFANPGQMNGLNDRLNEFIQQLIQMENSMEGSCFIPDLLKVITGELGQDYMYIHEEVDKSIDQYIQGLVNLGIDESKLGLIDQALAQYIMIEPYQFDHSQINDKRQHRQHQNQYKQQQQQKLHNDQQQQGDMQGIIYDQQSNVKQQQQQQNNFYQDDQSMYSQSISNQKPNNIYDQSPISQNNMSLSQNINQVLINRPNYFEDDCNFQYLHFFQDNSKTIKFIDLKAITKDPQSKQFQSSDLDIKFKIPMYSRSIITPQGDIILTGGLSVENRSQPTQNCYIVDYKKQSLTSIPSMHVARSSHGICYMNGFIYVVGGEDKDQVTDRCERYDIQNNRWQEIAPLNHPAANCSICSFRDQFIFKFSGNLDAFSQSVPIERYDVLNDQWQIINIQTQHEILTQIPNLTQVTQINDNEIIILGGNLEHQNVNFSTILTLNDEQLDDETVILYPSKPLPREGTFWYTPIIVQNLLFSLQNIPMQNNPDHSYFNQKLLLAFQGKSWKEIK